MDQFNERVYNYVRVDGETLRNINDNTRKIWDDAVRKGIKDIIDITEDDDKDKCYLVDLSVYQTLLTAAKESEGKDPYGIPNVNFTLIGRSDKRWEEFRKERLERGFDVSELWALDSTIANFILPRLKAFKEEHCGHPAFMSDETWDKEIDKMILAFECLRDENFGYEQELSYKENNEKWVKMIDKGLKSFIKHIQDLWW